ncbi:MAG TPA: sigma-54 dependent transcriptional regulator [Acidobacteriota bacterium]|nr:sigma-54 dependent transcriptional regulator [Acidobacteriota bacterium]
MRVLLIDQGWSSRGCEQLKAILAASGQVPIETFYCRGQAALAESIQHSRPDICILLPGGQDLDEKVRSVLCQEPALPTVIALEQSGPDRIARLLEAGCTDFLVPPFSESSVLPRIWWLYRQTRAAAVPVPQAKEEIGLRQIVGQAPAFLAEIEKVKAVSKYDANVVIEGETGTGKELFARAIHYLSRRSGGPFIPVNCGAIPDDLVENELFGHERGAYTGAGESYQGLIEEAEGGTLFLDEVSSLSSLAQVKLLRFLQDGEYRRLGSTAFLRGNVRVIAASNLELEKAADQGNLRKDLYYRLNTITLNLPPLRCRSEDIPLLAHHFAAKYAHKFDKPQPEYSPRAMEKLILHTWPGNVRELEHVVERAVLLTQEGDIGSEAISLPEVLCGPAEASFKEAKAQAIAAFEEGYVKKMLVAHQGNISQAARAARKDRRSFWELIRKHRIDVKALKRRLAFTASD